MITKIANEFLKEAGSGSLLQYIPGVKNLMNANRSRQLSNLAGGIKKELPNIHGTAEAQQAAYNNIKGLVGDSRFMGGMAGRYGNMTEQRLGTLQDSLRGNMWKQGLIGAGKLGLTGGALYGGGKLLFGGNPAPAAPQMQRAAY